MQPIYDLLRSPDRRTLFYLLGTAVLGIALGLIMLFYPEKTLAIIQVLFRIFQAIVSVAVLYFFLSKAWAYYKVKNIWMTVAYALPAVALVILIWFIHPTILYYAVAFLLLVSAVSEIAAAFIVPYGKFFLVLLAFIDLIMAWVIIKNPIALGVLFSWYVFFWGVSRLMFALELKRNMTSLPPSPSL